MALDQRYAKQITAVSHASRRLNKATDRYERALIEIDILLIQRNKRQAELDAARVALDKAKRADRDRALIAAATRDRDTLEDWNA